VAGFSWGVGGGACGVGRSFGYAGGVDADELLALYDTFERRGARPCGLTVETTPHVVRHVGPPGGPSWVAYADLSGVDADAVIQGEIARFAAVGQRFEWKHFDHDRPADLKERLLAAGFVAEESEALLVLDSAQPSVWIDAPHRHVVRDAGPEGWSDAVRVLLTVWPELADDFVPRFGTELRACPDRIRLFLAYDGETPVAVSWTLRSGPDTPFLGLFGGATLPEHRGRGIYRALVAERARSARDHGARFLTVDAGPMSAPILVRLGFTRLTTTTPCTWRPPPTS
jgi:GNAT superfamily N-acetyltransferase